MGSDGARLPHYLVEWYRPAIADEPFDHSVVRLMQCAASVTAAGSPVSLLATFAVPSDEVVLAVFDSASEESVAEVCRRAGWPPQRVTAAVDARFWRGLVETPASTT
jgi:hypothetical protein